MRENDNKRDNDNNDGECDNDDDDNKEKNDDNNMEEKMMMILSILWKKNYQNAENVWTS